jgi:uncharacterized protein with GYD domain
MVSAISLVKAVLDRESALYHTLREMDGTKSLYHVFGEHDFILIQEAEDMERLMALLRLVEGQGDVSATRTILVRSAGGLEKSPIEERPIEVLPRACRA